VTRFDTRTVVAAKRGSRGRGFVVILVLATLAFRNEGPLADAAKLLCFSLLSYAAMLGWSRVRSDSSVPLRGAVVSALVILLLSSAVALANGAEFGNWAQDVIAPVAFVMALPASAFISSMISLRRVETALILVSVTAGFSYALFWLERRNLADFDAFAGIASWYLPFAGAIYFFPLTRDSSAMHAVLWSLLTGLLVASGSRTAVLPVLLIVLYLPLRTLIVREKRLRLRFVNLIPAAALVIVLLLIFGSTTNEYLASGYERFVSTLELAKDGVDRDASFRERRTQNELAREAFESSPIVGTGPGNVYTWATPAGTQKSSAIAEAPYGLFADFGLVGAGALYFLLACIGLRSIRRIRDRRSSRADDTALLLVVAAFAHGLISSPFDDKGLAISLILVLTLAELGSNEESGRPPDGVHFDQRLTREF
jgi:hypothetical protein